jgi:CHAT domain-containing protein
MYLCNLGNSLQVRFGRTGELAELDEAITAIRSAVTATAEDYPERSAYLNPLGLALRARFERSGAPADREAAMAAFMDAAKTKTGAPSNRMLASTAWGTIASDTGWVYAAADGFAAAVELLPLLAWHGLSRTTREQHLSEYSGLASHAAASAIRAGRPERAVELLEAGRSVLWAQILNLRTDLTDLAEREPDLAARLDQIRAVLDSPLPDPAIEENPTAGDDPSDRLRVAAERVTADRRRLAREYDDLLSQIRGLEKFEHFLAPTPFAQLRTAAIGGPVVIVNTSHYGCHALVLTMTGVRVVDLPDLTIEQAADQGDALLGVLNRSSQRNRSYLDRERDRHTVFDILDWLWDTIAELVLTALGHTSSPGPDAAWPRIWWCPTGPLTVLPLHAAGYHPRHQRADNPASGDTVLDRVISSYTPTLTALLRARAAPVPGGPARLLAIGMPTTPDAADLPAAPDELDRVHAQYPITTRLQSPTPGDRQGPPPEPGTQPTITSVLAALRKHAWVHMACHGSQHLSDPTDSAFSLTDGPLRIADLIAQPNPGPRELAFLSACQTATGSPRAMDEAIHLAAAMQLLGYRHVIATLWSIYDFSAPDIAADVYATLTATGTPDADGAAQALHSAVAAARAKHPTEPLAWAPYLHIGPDASTSRRTEHLMTEYPSGAERHPDRLTGVSPVLAVFGQHLERVLADGLRPELRVLVPALSGTANDGLDEWRGYLALDWLLRTWLPAWLDLDRVRSKHAATLRELGRIVDVTSAQQAGQVVRQVPKQTVDEWLNRDRSYGRDAALDSARAVAAHAAEQVAWHAVPDSARVISSYRLPSAGREEVLRAVREAVWAARGEDVWNAGQDAAWEAIPAAARDGHVWAAAQDSARATVFHGALDAARPAAHDARAAWDATWIATRDAHAARDAARNVVQAAIRRRHDRDVWASRAADPPIPRRGIFGIREAARRRSVPVAARDEAVYHAALDAVQDRLAPIAVALQQSVVKLFREMITEPR